MNCNLLTSLSLRITGVIVLVNVFSGLPHDFLGLIRLSEQAKNSSLYPASVLFTLSAASVVLPGILGLLFVFYPSRISKIIVDEKENEMAKADFEPLQRVILSALGAYFIATALFDSVYLLAKLRIYFSFITNSYIMQGAPKLLPEDFASIISTLCQFIIGLFLLLGSKGLSSLITHLRGKPLTNIEGER